MARSIHAPRICSYFLLAACSLAALPVAAAVITPIAVYTQGTNGVSGLSGISDVAVSPDGKFVYTSSYSSSAVSVFQRDLATGILTYSSTITGATTAFSVDVSPDNKNVYVASPTGEKIFVYSRDVATGALTSVGAVSGYSGKTSGFVSVSVSPDAKTVYGVGAKSSANGLVVFSRDMDTGAIAPAADYQDNIDGHALGQLYGPTSSPIKNIVSSADGRFVYVTSTSDHAVTLFSRDAATGLLTQEHVYEDGVAGVDGLQGASSAKISPDGKHLYVTGQTENSVAIFSVNSASGALTYAGKATQGTDGITDLQAARSLAISPDGKYVYVSAITSNAVTVFNRDPATGLLTVNTVAKNSVDGVTGLAGPSGMAVDPLNRHLYVAGQSSSSLVAFSLPSPAVQVSVAQTSAPFNGGATILDPQLQVFDADSATLASATVSISQGFVNTDLLSIQTVPGITASYDAAHGVLTLTGTASLADYQAALRTLSFRSGADPSVPAGGYSSRTITITVSDGANTSAVSSIVVTVGPAGAPGPAPSAPASIPTLSEWGLILVSSLLAAFGIARMRSRRSSKAL